jgi:hypothetical protein
MGAVKLHQVDKMAAKMVAVVAVVAQVDYC